MRFKAGVCLVFVVFYFSFSKPRAPTPASVQNLPGNHPWAQKGSSGRAAAIFLSPLCVADSRQRCGCCHSLHPSRKYDGGVQGRAWGSEKFTEAEIGGDLTVLACQVLGTSTYRRWFSLGTLSRDSPQREESWLWRAGCPAQRARTQGGLCGSARHFARRQQKHFQVAFLAEGPRFEPRLGCLKMPNMQIFLPLCCRALNSLLREPERF